ncbi:MAG: MEKHLA domain-containing protein [Methylophilaceae bacterium]|nr:MEKHLA domain-containing protein [Methylophilaceae bacterium]
MSAVVDIERHVELLRANYRRWLKHDFIDAALRGRDAVCWLDDAPFALVSHGTEADPIFNYGNATALRLFGMDWAAFTTLPSRLSAMPMDRAERARVLACVARDGYIDGYTGVRVRADGRRFRIQGVTVWNLVDERGAPYGQAALIREWTDWDEGG